MAKLCSCKQYHIIETEIVETDENDEEYQKHTKEFQAAYEDYYDEISEENSTKGEILMAQWIQKNHPILCCEFRHKCREFS